MPASACPRHQTPPRSASGAAGDFDHRGWGGGPAPAGGCKSLGAPTDSGRGASANQPSPRVPTETLARAREPGTPNFAPRDAPPRHLRFHLRAPGPGPRRYVPSSPGPPEPPARPSSRPRKTHPSATARSRARKPRTHGAGQPPPALALDTCHVGKRPG